MATDQEFTPEQLQLLMRLDALADQIKKAQFLNVHFRAFELANVAWEQHVRANAALGSRVIRSPAGAVLADDAPQEKPEAVAQQIGWFDPGSKRFCYSDVKEHRPDQHQRYSIPVILGAVLADDSPEIEEPPALSIADPPGPPDPPRPPTRRDVGSPAKGRPEHVQEQEEGERDGEGQDAETPAAEETV